MEVTVIIPTYNGANKILKGLKALEVQSVDKFNVIIVIDGSTDNTLEILNSQSFNFNYRIVVQNNGGRSVAKNHGAENAKDGLLIFMDDDMIPCVEFIEEHFIHHNKFLNSILTGSYQSHKDIENYDFGLYCLYLHHKWSKDLNILKADEKMTELNYFIQSGNCSMLKSVFEDIGGFDVRLNDAEDYYFSVIALRKNIDMYYSQLPWAYHYEIKSCSSTIKRMRQYTIAQRQLKELDEEIAQNSKYDNVTPNKFKLLAFKCFTFKFLIKWIDNGFFRFLPAKYKFKLYDIIITANGVYFQSTVKL